MEVLVCWIATIVMEAAQVNNSVSCQIMQENCTIDYILP